MVEEERGEREMRGEVGRRLKNGGQCPDDLGRVRLDLGNLAALRV